MMSSIESRLIFLKKRRGINAPNVQADSCGGRAVDYETICFAKRVEDNELLLNLLCVR